MSKLICFLLIYKSWRAHLDYCFMDLSSFCYFLWFLSCYSLVYYFVYFCYVSLCYVLLRVVYYFSVFPEPSCSRAVFWTSACFSVCSACPCPLIIACFLRVFCLPVSPDRLLSPSVLPACVPWPPSFSECSAYLCPLTIACFLSVSACQYPLTYCLLMFRILATWKHCLCFLLSPPVPHVLVTSVFRFHLLVL